MSSTSVASPGRPDAADVVPSESTEQANLVLFNALLHAETENRVEEILRQAGYFEDAAVNWQPLGGLRNNFSTVGNQQADPGGAMVEKIVNSIDAMLMAECYRRGIDPKGDRAPLSMADAVEQFFGIRQGRIDALTATEQTKLADNIHVIATGEKGSPCYMIVDRGEGQTPASFPTTLLGLREDNKMRIPFVQGKFHSGGTGVLQFCGDKNYELIASRRNPCVPTSAADATREHWGFTLVRRVRPTGTERNSRYMYLAPGGAIPSFRANAIQVLPGQQSARQAPKPYVGLLQHGTCIKLYEYRWRRGIATLEARYELEKFLHSPCLPFRITESRSDYTANYFSTTVSGVWVTIASSRRGDDASAGKVEDGFPAPGVLNLQGIGRLPYQIVVFKEGAGERHLPTGVCYTLNGQVHGRAPSDFVSSKLEFSYLKGSLLVSVDCAQMDTAVREDWLLNSRDRTRKNDTDKAIQDALARDLKGHAGLRELNARRRQNRVQNALADDQEGAEYLQELLNTDPALATLLGFGSRLVTRTGPSAPTLFVGKQFPTYFRLARAGRGDVVKTCPLNRTVIAEFETDAVNDYFTRVDSPGQINIVPANLCEGSHLWDGRFTTRFRAPWNAKPGDIVEVKVSVTDVERDSVQRPFEVTFKIKVEVEEDRTAPPGTPPTTRRTPRTNGTASAPAVALPRRVHVRREEWDRQQPPFTPYTSLRVVHNGEGGYDFLLNVDNAYLMTALARGEEAEKALVRFWFEWGLVLAALGMLQEQKRRKGAGESQECAEAGTGEVSDGDDALERVNKACDGVARVIVPICRKVSEGPPG